MDLVANRYLILDGVKARTGGSATVRKAVDSQSGSSVAVKFVMSNDDPVLQKLFDREKQLLRRSAHPHIISLLDDGVDESGTPYLVLPWIEDTLRDHLSTQHWDSWSEAWTNISRPLVDAVAYLHRLEIEHRDLKPANILLSEGGPVLADFGIAKLHREDDNTSQTVGHLGTHLYVPPEGPKAPRFVRDVFSLGVIFVECLAPTPERPRSFHELLPSLDRRDIPEEFAAVIAASLNIDPDIRPRNAIEFLHRLDAAAASQIRTQKLRIQLALTNTARLQVVGETGFADRAPQLIAQDLAGVVYANFRWDAEKGAPDSSTIIVLGQALRLMLKLTDDRKQFLVVNARRPSYEDLERARSRAFQVDAIASWTTASARPSLVDHSVDRFLEQLLEYHENIDNQDRSDDRSAAAILLNDWRRLLQAREALALGSAEILEYENVVANGKESSFTLTEEPLEDLLNSEWQWLDKAAHPSAAGIAVQQLGLQLAIRWHWGGGSAIPTRGQLHPYLGPSQVALDRQRDALRRLESSETVQARLLDVLTDPSKASPPLPQRHVEWFSDLDASKQDAVEAALGTQDCIVVVGPPGTGKTRFIAEVVAQERARNADARILIVSQTHVAIDNALDRLPPNLKQGTVRIAREDDDRVSKGSQDLLLAVQRERWSMAIRRQAEAYFRTLAADAGVDKDHLDAIIALEEFLAGNRRRRELETRLHSANDSRDSTSSRETPDDPGEIRRSLELARADIADSLARAQLLLQGDLTISLTLGETEAKSAVDLLSAESTRADELLGLLRLQTDWLQRVRGDSDIEAVFVESSNVIAGTCLGFISHKAVKNLRFDVCIIDEASKATSTEALVALVRSDRFILVGDGNQLPPQDEELLQDDALLKEQDLSKDFVRETLFARLVDQLPKSNRFLLDRQYRMVPAIGNLISTCFYDGAVTSVAGARLDGYERFSPPVLWLDTSKHARRGEHKDANSSSSSYLNRLEVEIAFDRLKAINTAIERGVVASPALDKRYSVLLIAPYRSQLDELQRRWDRLAVKPQHLDVAIESVDAVQGREADLVIFTVTRSNSERKLGFLGQPYWRRINVALSRARFGLTVIGDADFSSSVPGGLKRVLQYMSENQGECEIRGVDVSDRPRNR